MDLPSLAITFSETLVEIFDPLAFTLKEHKVKGRKFFLSCYEAMAITIRTCS
jgi:hypothetical protein